MMKPKRYCDIDARKLTDEQDVRIAGRGLYHRVVSILQGVTICHPQVST
jgi:hypothetical protein